MLASLKSRVLFMVCEIGVWEQCFHVGGWSNQMGLSFNRRHNFLHTPDTIGNYRFHRWRRTKNQAESGSRGSKQYHYRASHTKRKSPRQSQKTWSNESKENPRLCGGEVQSDKSIPSLISPKPPSYIVSVLKCADAPPPSKPHVRLPVVSASGRLFPQFV